MRLYKILTNESWQQRTHVVPRAPIDEIDGYIHLSDATQLRETAEKHFSNQASLSLIILDSERFSAGTLRWEPSRGGAMFPHVYGEIPLEAVLLVHSLVGPDPGPFAYPPEVLASEQAPAGKASG